MWLSGLKVWSSEGKFYAVRSRDVFVGVSFADCFVSVRSLNPKPRIQE